MKIAQTVIFAQWRGVVIGDSGLFFFTWQLRKQYMLFSKQPEDRRQPKTDEFLDERTPSGADPGGGRAGLGPPPPPPQKKKKKKKWEKKGKEGKGKEERRERKKRKKKRKGGRRRSGGRKGLASQAVDPPPPPPIKKIREKEGKGKKWHNFRDFSSLFSKYVCMCLLENDKLLNLQPGKKYDSWDSYMSGPRWGGGLGAWGGGGGGPPNRKRT